GCRLSDPGFLFLLVFAANLAHRTKHSATKRASVDRRVLARYRIPFETVAQRYINHMSICSDTDRAVCQDPFYKKIHWNVHVGRSSSLSRSRTGIRDVRAVVPEFG